MWSSGGAAAREPAAPAPAGAASQAVAAATPADLIAQAVADNRAAIEGDVLRAALALSATGFEDLVIRLLETMGHGRAGSAATHQRLRGCRSGRHHQPGPAGVGLDLCAGERYAEDRADHRPSIHEFAGALLGKQGDRGVYITTSRFTDGARREAERINARIELIDGGTTGQLTRSSPTKLGCRPKPTTLYRLDEDFFETL